MTRSAQGPRSSATFLLQLLVTCLLFSGSFAGPAHLYSGHCSTSCKAPTKFSYKVGSSYYYKYTTDVFTTAGKESKIATGVHVTALAEITVASSCEFVLELHDVLIKESKGSTSSREVASNSDSLAQELVGKPLVFSFDDGEIEFLCSDDEELLWVLNFKRGLLSAFQHGMKKWGDDEEMDEVDVNGKCLTTYESIESSVSQKTTLRRSKELSECKERPAFVNALHSLPYTNDAFVANLPIMNSRQDCIQIIQDGKMNSVNCEEIHSFDPFNRGDSGAQTVVSQSLTYSSEIRKTVLIDGGYQTNRKRLPFERTSEPSSSEEEMDQIRHLLQRLVKDKRSETPSQATYDFVELVERLRRISYEDLQRLMAEVGSTEPQAYIRDALPIISSTGSVRMMIDFVLQRSMSTELNQQWLNSLVLIRDPTLEMIVDAKRLFATSGIENQAFLSVSTLIYAYCQTHENCENVPEVEDLISTMYFVLGESCKNEDLSRLVYVLKGIGNTGLLHKAGDGEGILNRCFMDDSNANEIKLAALDAFRRSACGSYDQEPIVDLFANTTLDPEVRIKAYLTLMYCPSRDLIEQVQVVLQNEVVNQVSWFVWSHLENLKETTSPDKQVIKDLLGDEFLIEKFNGDARKFSQNYEMAYFSQDGNYGVSSDANLIFSTDSFLPRSASLNLTTHLFGKSLNLFEMGTRIDSLEHLLEPIFGPNGLFPDERVTEAIHSPRRNRRDVRTKVKGLKDLYEVASLGDPNPSASMYARVLGNELVYKTWDIDPTDFKPLEDGNGNSWLDYNKLLQILVQGADFTRSTVLFDVSYNVPTGAGIPVKLSAQSSARVRLQTDASINVGQLLVSREIELSGKLEPSVAVHVDGAMSIGFGGCRESEIGVRIQNELQTTTSVKGQVTIKGTKLVHLSLSLPQDRQEVFKAASEMMIFKGSDKKEAIDLEAHGNQDHCVESDAVGLKLCSQWVLPEDGPVYPPMESPLVASVYLVKTDTISSYQFDYKFDRDDKETLLNIVFDTPGSQIDRRHTANFLLSSESGKLDASVYTPWTSLGLEGKYSPEQKYLQMTMAVDQEQVFLINAGLNGRNGKYEPRLLLQMHEQTLVELDGEVTVGGGKSSVDATQFSLRLRHLTETPITLNGNVSHNGDQVQTQAQLVSPLLTGGILSTLVFKQGHLLSKLTVDYSWNKEPSVVFDVNAKARKLQRKDLTKLSSTLSFAVRDSPDKNFEVGWETERTTGYCDTSLRLTYAKTSWEARTLYKNQRRMGQVDMALSASLASPRHDMDYKFEVGHTRNGTTFTLKAMGRTEKDKEFKAELVGIDESTSYLTQNRAVAKVLWPGTEYVMKAVLRETAHNDYILDFTMAPQSAAEKKVTITYKNSSGVSKVQHLVTLRSRGFTSRPVAGSVEMSAADAEAHWDSQVSFEEIGGLPSTKYGVSLDFKHLKSGTIKVEGKLTLDDKKFTTDVAMRSSRNGARLLTVDLHGGSRILLEATVNGDMFGPLSAIFTVYPDRDRRPDHKFELDASYDRQNLQVNVNYFGARTLTSLTYDGESKAQLTCELWNGKRYAVMIEVPQMEALSTSAFIKIETPIEGYEVMVFSSSHSLITNGHVKTVDVRVEGRLNQVEGVLIGSGSVGPYDTSAMFTLDATGYKSIQGSMKGVYHQHEKSLSVMAGRSGDPGFALRTEIITSLEALTSGFFFSGYGIIPEIAVELAHQSKEHLNTFGKVTWKYDEERGNEISAHVTGTKEPLRGKLLVRTPWENLERLVVNFGLANNPETKLVELGFDGGNVSFFPAGFKAEFSTKEGSFNYTFLTEWKDESQTHKRYELSTEGYYFVWSDANVSIKLGTGLKNYQIQWIGEGDYKREKMECIVSIDASKYSSGVEWSSDVQAGRKLGSLWIERASSPRFSVEFDQLVHGGTWKLNFLVLNGDEALGKVTSNVEHRGWDAWDFDLFAQVKNTDLPAIRVSSKHRREDNGDIDHESMFHLVTEGREAYEDPEDDSAMLPDNSGKGLLRFKFLGGKNLGVFIKYEDIGVDANGTIIFGQDSHTLDMVATSELFSPINIKGRLEKVPYTLTLQVGNDDMNFLSASLETKRDERESSAKIQFASDYGIALKGVAIHDKEENRLSLQLKEESSELVDLSLKAQAKNGQGEGIFKSKITAFNIRSQLTIDGSYKINGEGVELDGKLNHNGISKSLKLNGIWQSALKSIQVNAKDGLGKLHSIEGRLEGLTSLRASYKRNGHVVHSLEVAYDPVQDSDYDFGLHTLTVIIDSANYRTLETRVTFGLDLEGQRVLLKSRLPVNGWEDCIFSGHLNFDDLQKTLLANFTRNGREMYAFVDLMQARNGSRLTAELASPVKGLNSLGGSAWWTMDRGFDGGIVLRRDSSVLELLGTLKARLINLSIRTPAKLLESARAAVSWNLAGAIKSAEAKGEWNGQGFESQARWSVADEKGDVKITIAERKKHTIEMKYDLKGGYLIELVLLEPEAGEKDGSRPQQQQQQQQQQQRVKIHLSPLNVHLEAETGWKVLEHVMIKGVCTSCDKKSDKYNLKTEWKWNDLHQGNAQLDLVVGNNKYRLRGDTSLENYRNFAITFSHILEGRHRTLSLEGQVESRPGFKLIYNANLGQVFESADVASGAAATVEIGLQLPMFQLDNYQLELGYQRERGESHTVVGLLKQGNTQLLDLNSNFKNSIPYEYTLDVKVPKHNLVLEAKSKIDLAASSFLDASVSKGDLQYRLETYIDKGAIRVLMTKTDGDDSRQVKLDAEMKDGKFKSQVDYDKYQFVFQGEVNLRAWLNSVVSLELHTPFRHYESMAIHLQTVSSEPGKVTATASWQDPLHRYTAKAETNFDHANRVPEHLQMMLTLHTPLEGLEHVDTNLTYAVTDKYNLNLSVAKSMEQVLNFEGEFGGAQLKLKHDATNLSFLKSTAGNALVQWESYPIRATFDLKSKDVSSLDMTFDGEVHGLFHGDLKMSTGIPGFESLRFVWSGNGTQYNGHALTRLTVGEGYERAFRTSWKMERWESLRLDVWAKTDETMRERGFSAQISLTSRRNKVEKVIVGVKYIIQEEEQNLAMTAALKRTQDSLTFDGSLETPFEVVNMVSGHGKLMMRNEPSIDILLSVNGEIRIATNALVALTPLKSKFKLNFNAPGLCELFSVSTQYDVSEREKFLEIAFSQGKYQVNVRANATVPQQGKDGNEIELHLLVASNVPMMQVSASGSLKAGYRIAADGTRHIVFLVNSEKIGKWEVVGLLRPLLNFQAALNISSPDHDLFPSIKFDTNYRGSSLQGANFELMLQLYDYDPVVLGVTTRPERLVALLTSGLTGLEDVQLEAGYLMKKGNPNKTLEIQLKINGEAIHFTGHLNTPDTWLVGAEGSLELNSTWIWLPRGNLRMKMDQDGNIDVQGQWGENTITLNGYSKEQDGKTGAWLDAAETVLKLGANGQDLLTIKSVHTFSYPVFSLNITFSDEYKFSSLFDLSEETKRLVASVMFGPEQTIELFVEAGSGQFKTTASSPWTAPLEASGMYTLTQREQSAQASFIYADQKSSFQVTGRNSDKSVDFNLHVDVPALDQKLDVVLQLRKVNQGLVRGNLTVIFSDRRVTVDAELTTVPNPSKNAKRLVLYLGLPNSDKKDVSADINLEYPIKGLASFLVTGSVQMPEGTSSATLGYTLPINGEESLGLTAKLDTPYLSKSPLAISTLVNVERLGFFTLELQQKDQKIMIEAEQRAPLYALKAMADLSEWFPEEKTFSLEVRPNIEWPSDMSLWATGTCGGDKYFTELSFGWKNESISGKMIVDAPAKYLSKPKEARFDLEFTENGRYGVSVAGSWLNGEMVSVDGQLVKQDVSKTVLLRLNGLNGNHYVQGSVTSVKRGEWEFGLNGESSRYLRGKRIGVSGSLKEKDDGFMLDINCRTRGEVHSGKVVLEMNWIKGHAGVEIKSAAIDSISGEMDWEMNPSYLTSRASLDIFGEHHSLGLHLHRPESRLSFTLASPLLPKDRLEGRAKFVVRRQHGHVLGEIVMGDEDVWKVEGLLSYGDLTNARVHVGVQTPFDEWDRVTIGGRIGDTEISAMIHTPFVMLPKAEMNISGLPLFKLAELTRQSRMQPQVSVKVPWFDATIGGVYKLPVGEEHGEFGVDIGYRCETDAEGKLYHLRLQLPSLEAVHLRMSKPVRLRLTGKFPIQHLESIEWELGGRINWKSWVEITAIGEVNGKKMEFTSVVGHENGNRAVSLLLHTPFPGYEKYMASLRLDKYVEESSGQKLLVQLQLPSWEKFVKLEIDYRYRFNSLTDLDLQVAVTTPEFFAALPRVTARFNTSCPGGEEEGDGNSTASLHVQFGEHQLHVIGQVEATQESLLADFEINKSWQTGQDRAHFKLARQGENGDMTLALAVTNVFEPVFKLKIDAKDLDHHIDLDARIETKFELVQSATFTTRLLHVGKNGIDWTGLASHLNVNFHLEHNKHRYLQLELVKSVHRKSLKVHNILVPVSLSLVYDRVPGTKFASQLEACWDTSNARETTIGFEIFAKTEADEKSVAFKAQCPSLGGTILVISQSETHEEYAHSVKLGWFAPVRESEAQELGWSLRVIKRPSYTREMHHIFAEVSTPWRIVHTSWKAFTIDKELRHEFELGWDARTEPGKKLGFQHRMHKSTSWTSKNVISHVKLFHSAYATQPEIRIHRTFLNHQLRHVTIRVKSSKDVTQDLTVDYSRGALLSDGLQLSFAHPASNFNTTMVLRKTTTKLHISATYVDSNSQLHEAHLLLVNDKNHKLLDLGGKMDQLRLLRLEVVNKAHKQGAALQILDTLVNATLYAKKPWLELSAMFDHQRELHLVAGLSHKREAMLRAWRHESGVTIVDLFGELRLNSSKFLDGIVEWRPQLVDDAARLWDEGDVDFVIDDQILGLKKNVLAIISETKLRWNTVSPVARSTIQQGLKYTIDELEAVKHEVELVIEILREAYEDNRFHVQDLLGLMGDVSGFVKEVCHEVFKTTGEFSEIVSEGIKNIYETVTLYVGNLEAILMPLWDSLESGVRTKCEELVSGLRKFKSSITDLHTSGLRTVKETLAKLEEAIMGNAFVKKALSLWDQFTEWRKDFTFDHQLNLIWRSIEENVIQPVRDMVAPYMGSLEKRMKEGLMEEILETPPMPYVVACGKRIQEAIVRFLEVIEAEETAKMIIGQALKSMDGLIERNIPKPQILWDLDSGKIRFHQPLVFIDWEDFTDFPSLTFASGGDESEKDFVTLTDHYYKLLDTLESIRPALDLDMREMLPPYHAHAMLSGEHHFYTFDKKYYRFSGDCSYVLFADLLHNNFTLLLNYGPSPGGFRKKSYTVLMEPNHMIEIDAVTLKVTADETGKIDLPAQIGSTFMRRGHNTIELYDTRGFQLTCSKEPSICVFSLSGWYFGKTGGLFGTYDNEPANDFRSPEKVVLDNPTQFVNSWRVGKGSGGVGGGGGQCRTKNTSGPEEDQEEDVDGICESNFGDRQSPLRPCFSRVNTSVFAKMCRHDVSSNINRASRHESACTAISAYVAECQRQGVDLWLPTNCVTCKLEDGTTLASGENATLRAEGPLTPPQSTDVVILLEQSACYSKPDVVEIVHKLDAALRASNLTDTRYALVTFGGSGAFYRAHMSAFYGNIWVHSTLFKVPGYVNMAGPGNGDLYEAIEYSQRSLKFRAGVAKTFVAVTCGGEKCGNDKKYADELTLLLVNDIKLHLLTPHPFKLQRPKSRGMQQIFGIDKEGAFTNEHWRRPEQAADRPLKRQISMPKDFCTPLALESKGSAFQFTRSAASKSVEVWANVAADKGKPSPCQHCECMPDKSGSPNVVCSTCFSERLESILISDAEESATTDFTDVYLEM